MGKTKESGMEDQQKQAGKTAEDQENLNKVIEICKNLTISIENASKRNPVEYQSGTTTNPSANAAALKRKRDHLMKTYKLTKKDLT